MKNVASKRSKGRPIAPRRKKTARVSRGLAGLIGLFASKAGDLAARHDDYLYDWKKTAS